MSDRSAVRVVGTNDSASRDLAQLLDAPVDPAASSSVRERIAGVVVGTLVGFFDVGATPLVTYDGQPGAAALPAQATVNLHGAHIGRRAVLMFEEGDPYRPIIVGCLQETKERAPSAGLEQVVVEADHDRVVVSARDRIVLRCGKASITLSKEGKVIVQGAYVSHQSSGVLRLKGGAVQIN